ncbi:site-specific integrase [Antarcticirhabdus aurantiaca]|uniref:Site-specific integrase n=1 Tax=Antarcticirhabdus aurantiaca TaxID=2606717 RepID=A0ACD4NW48_9HYPH|nr:site-specific integrase [Antarcticirhabdus aurantiaca]WAJ31010.1 site-specific integrase [Jeongeuplla avenae]
MLHRRVRDVSKYVAWRREIVQFRIPIASERYRDAAKKLEDWLSAIADMARPDKSTEKRGLEPELRSRFLSVTEPGSPENPFDEAHRHRNHALLRTYFDLGVRKAEPLLLKTGDLSLRGSHPSLFVTARPDDPVDPRSDEPLVKTASRELPVGPRLMEALETWIISHRTKREKYPGAKRHPFIFVSENGRPMALRTVYDLFVTIRERFPEFPADFSPHTLRHDWNDRYSEFCDRIAKAAPSDADTQRKLQKKECGSAPLCDVGSVSFLSSLLRRSASKLRADPHSET